MSRRKLAAVLFYLTLFALGVWAVYTYLPTDLQPSSAGRLPSIGVDWIVSFRPAARSLLDLESPYTIPGFFNPPWALIPLLPFALLPAGLGAAFLFVLNIFSLVFAGKRMRMNVLALVVFLLFSGTLVNAWNGNIEGLLAIGFILPPQVGLFFVLCKPQFGLGVAIFWIVQAWREGGIRKVARVVAPVSIALGISFVLFGFWPARTPSLVDMRWNTSLYPYGVPIGLALLAGSLWSRNIFLAMASSPFFAPYVAGHTWAVTWLGILLLVPERIRIFHLVRKYVNIPQT